MNVADRRVGLTPMAVHGSHSGGERRRLCVAVELA